MTKHNLDVWLNEVKVGRLAQVDGRLRFSYNLDYLQSSLPLPLSLSLPLREKPFSDREARPFFAGLLPEETKREQIARVLGVSQRNDFALLDGIGGECAGAVTFVRPNEMPPSSSNSPQVRMLKEEDLLRLLEDLPRRPLLAGDEGIRISLAGAQDKLPIRMVSDDWIAVPLNGTPSTHILKTPIATLDDSVINEGFCLKLAGQLGIEVAPCEIRPLKDNRILIVERYDRSQFAQDHFKRLHQEDFCQALGILPENKYEAEGGPSFKACFELVRQAVDFPADWLPELLNAALFNALIGNHDAHGKNFSLVYLEGGTIFAPLYDLLCTAAYPDLTKKMAMKIGGYYEFDQVMPRHWERFAREAGLSWPGVRSSLLAMAERLPVECDRLHQDFIDQGLQAPVLDRIKVIIHERCEQTLKLFSSQRQD